MIAAVKRKQTVWKYNDARWSSRETTGGEYWDTESVGEIFRLRCDSVCHQWSNTKRRIDELSGMCKMTPLSDFWSVRQAPLKSRCHFIDSLGNSDMLPLFQKSCNNPQITKTRAFPADSKRST